MMQCTCIDFSANSFLVGVANFLVGLVFLPLRNFLADGDVNKEGRVFYVFAAMLAFFSFMLLQTYRG